VGQFWKILTTREPEVILMAESAIGKTLDCPFMALFVRREGRLSGIEFSTATFRYWTKARAEYRRHKAVLRLLRNLP
jgi:hypothetical protein